MLATGGALGLSLGLHTLLVAAFLWGSERGPSLADPPPREQPDIWRGKTLDVDTVLAAADPVQPPRAPERAAPASVPAPREAPEPALPPSAPPPPQEPEAARGEPPRRAAPEAEGRQRDPPRREPRVASVEDGLDVGASVPSQPFGAEGAEGPAREFAKAFARALPPAIRSDPSWQTAATDLDLEFSLKAFFGPDGRVDRIETTPPRLPKRVEQLCHKTLLFLGIGRFAHSEASAGSGSQTLFLAIKLDDEPASEDLPRIAYEPPSAKKPGHALYTFESGRNVTLWIAHSPGILRRRPGR